MNAKKTKHTVYILIKVIVLGVFLVVTIFPFLWMAITSIKPQDEIFKIPLRYFPSVISFENYFSLLNNSAFSTAIFNSIIVSLISALLAVVFAVMGSYVLTRFKFRGKRALGYYFLVTQMLPTFIGLAPLYQLLSSLNMIDSLPTLIIIESTYMLSFSVITLRGYLQNSPIALEESAMIDGCGRIRTLLYIVLPVILPGLAATYIFGFVQCWNDLFTPVMFMNQPQNYTIPVALNAMVAKTDVNWGELSAGTVTAIFPTIIMFAFSQKYIASGLTAGAVKG